MDDFIIYGLIAGIGVAIVAGVTGCFVVWRRMAYFGDSLAHSALLGVALGMIAGISKNIGIIIVCSVFALLLLLLQRRRMLATDTLLGILAHAALSIGMVAISLMEMRIDLHSYLFGDIFTVTREEIYRIYIGGGLVLAVLLMSWSSLVLTTINESLAMAENIRTNRSELIFMFLMTIVVAVSIKIAGMLLITSMLIIPAAAARQISRSPEGMAVTSSIIGVISVIGGIALSVYFDTPSGPSIVATATAIFFAILPLSYLRA